MTYSSKKKLDRRNSIMATVRKELKANNVFVPPESLKQLASVLDPKYFYDVKVLRDTEAASEELKLRNLLTQTSMGSRGTLDTGNTAFGDVKFGEKYGTVDSVETQSDGDFDLNVPFGVIIETRDWRSWDGDDCGNYNTETATIVIYSPDRIYDNDYASRKDDELNKLCQLREVG